GKDGGNVSLGEVFVRFPNDRPIGFGHRVSPSALTIRPTAHDRRYNRSATGSPRRTERTAASDCSRRGWPCSARAATCSSGDTAAGAVWRRRSRPGGRAAPARGALGSRGAIITRPMPRDSAHLSARAAVERLRPGMKVLIPPGCGEPTALLTEISAQSDGLGELTVLAGIQLGDFGWARPEHAALRAAVWQMSPRLADARRRGRAEFVPVRYFDLMTEFVRGGHWAPDCVIVHTAPADARDYLSLGVSVGVALPAARKAPLVIAQVNPNMPRTRGNCWLHTSQIDAWVDVDEPLLEYPPPAVGEIERAIGRHVAGLVPDRATVQ